MRGGWLWLLLLASACDASPRRPSPPRAREPDQRLFLGEWFALPEGAA